MALIRSIFFAYLCILCTQRVSIQFELVINANVFTYNIAEYQQIAVLQFALDNLRKDNVLSDNIQIQYVFLNFFYLLRMLWEIGP